MKQRLWAGLVAAAMTAAGHHSFSADFDVNKPVTLTGTVVKFEMMNPHSWIHVDVKEADGKVARWEVETGSTNSLFRRGWKKDSLKPGDAVIIEGYRAKDGTNTANANAVKLPDGRRVFAGSSRDAEKEK
jgi:hypothetical protein